MCGDMVGGLMQTRATTLNKKVFTTLFFSLFVTITGVGIVVPLLPVYAHGLGAGGFAIGLIFGAFSLSRTVLLPYFGRLSDRKGRKPFILTGLFCYALVSLAFTFADSVTMLIVIRFFQGASSAMIMPVVQAYVGDITPANREGFVMGLFNMSMFLGLSLGPLLGGMINDRFSLTTAFVCMGILSLVGFGLSARLLPPTHEERVVTESVKPSGWRHIVRDRGIALLAFFRFAYTAAIGIIWGFLPVLASDELGLSSTAIGLLVMLGVFVSGLAHVPMGYLADRVSKRTMMTVGGTLVALSMISYLWVESFWGLFGANLVFGLGGGISMPPLMALSVIKGNQVQAMGSVMALLTMAHSFGMLCGAVLAGVMMDLFDLRHAFPLGAVLMAACVIWLVASAEHVLSAKSDRSSEGAA
jgi:MFS family permease